MFGLGIEGAMNYAELAEKILRLYDLLGARMSLMWHFYTFHPIWTMSAMRWGKVSSEYKIKVMESGYQRKLIHSMRRDDR